ncbi:hypothetical protein H257_18098 [Aphanomyces astaci]|uniref:Uncharacterized protein n=1 Tax=Aphanomyces astaci TaxID=112090 RepID=W4FEH1_APHAT|nr:hypothetical protein H257_18098 [Aphanomyces astaci]ETV65108.1 hypothetical protein H257_18098 [Aphanomyces astaci]|eukprot:XP_009845411.1 hypothetical protein H257_18098 [Aphanomyces astaci]
MSSGVDALSGVMASSKTLYALNISVRSPTKRMRANCNSFVRRELAAGFDVQVRTDRRPTATVSDEGPRGQGLEKKIKARKVPPPAQPKLRPLDKDFVWPCVTDIRQAQDQHAKFRGFGDRPEGM